MDIRYPIIFAVTAATLAVVTSVTVMAESLVVNCDGSIPFQENSSICGSKGSFVFDSAGTSTSYFVRVIAPESHCSDVSYQIFKHGGSNAIGFTPRLGPGQSANVDIGRGYNSGTIKLQIGAIGFVGGCNEGTIGSFGAQVDVIPTP